MFAGLEWSLGTMPLPFSLYGRVGGGGGGGRNMEVRQS